MKVVFYLCLLICSFVTVKSWGPDGHRVIADIAYKEIKDTTRAKLDVWLSKYNTTLWDIAPYADHWDHQPGHEWAQPQHYVDLPDNASGVIVKEDCTPFCVITAIHNYTSRFLSPATTDEEKWFALEMLVHYYGDVHQPMHVSYTSDRGGNNINVTFFGELWNLHALWDSGLIDLKYNNSHVKLANVVLNEMTKSMKEAYAAIDDPERMANETFISAIMSAYNIPEDHVLGDAYYTVNFRVVKKLLGVAGVRLSVALNRIFESDRRRYN